jgi:hypothetical protein
MVLGCGVELVVCVSVVRVWVGFVVVSWVLGVRFLVGFGMFGSLRGVFTPARNGRHL